MTPKRNRFAPLSIQQIIWTGSRRYSGRCSWCLCGCALSRSRPRTTCSPPRMPTSCTTTGSSTSRRVCFLECTFVCVPIVGEVHSTSSLLVACDKFLLDLVREPDLRSPAESSTFRGVCILECAFVCLMWGRCLRQNSALGLARVLYLQPRVPAIPMCTCACSFLPHINARNLFSSLRLQTDRHLLLLRAIEPRARHKDGVQRLHQPAQGILRAHVRTRAWRIGRRWGGIAPSSPSGQ